MELGIEEILKEEEVEGLDLVSKENDVDPYDDMIGMEMETID
ncbi:hypothetical protein VCHA51O444_10564 [Vibrio chagasii]|nr:hypothetical protein VCHA51O444_10564 [Vibrio chagasii]CAH7355233.1 hypothetical protein VCHA53O474_30372 [Vibrio chagasii]